MVSQNEALSPPGSSTYDSNTMYVGDGTWDSGRNTFLLPNLVGLNFETMRYNGMGNRFRDLPQYHTLILGHGILAVITFLFIVPAAILIAGYYGRNPRWALRFHIYLQILTVALTTVLFILGFMAVGPERSLTNPHHGIGVAMYVLILVQAIGGGCIHRREKGRARRKLPVVLVLHQWLGRGIALLGFAQVPLGLTLYGSPKYTFILYAVWMTFLLVLFFILSYRAMPLIGGGYAETHTSISHGGTVIEEKKKSRFGILGPLAAGAGIATLLGRRNRSRSRSRMRRDEVIGSRRDSGSFIEEEKIEHRKENSGFMGKLLKGGAVIGAGALAKNWWDKRQRRRDDGSEYSSVANDTPSRRHGRHGRQESVISDSTVSVHRMEEGRPGGPILPGPGGPLAAATAISAAERPGRPTTPRPGGRPRRDSYSSYSYYSSELSPSRRPSHKVRNGVLATLGLGWFAKKMKDRRDRQKEDRLDREEAERVERERLARHGGTPSRLTGDGFAPPNRRRRTDSVTHSSDLSSIIVPDPHNIRPGTQIPPIPATYGNAPIPTQSGNVTMPSAPPDPQGILHQDTVESGSENYFSTGGRPHRRHSSRRRREGEAAAIAATTAAAALAAEEERRRRHSRSRSHSRPPGPEVVSPPVSVKVKMHGDRNQNVTLRRLTEEEAAAEREARRGGRRRRADSLSSLSGTDTAASRRRYRRDDRDGSAPPPPPPAMAPLSPPNPAFAGGRRPKDSAYYSGRPAGEGPITSNLGSPESHGTWSGMSASDVTGAGGSVSAAERRRRRRLERQRVGGQGNTVDFT